MPAAFNAPLATTAGTCCDSTAGSISTAAAHLKSSVVDLGSELAALRYEDTLAAQTHPIVFRNAAPLRSTFACASTPRFAQTCIQVNESRMLDGFEISVLVAMAELRGPSSDASIIGRAQVFAGIIRQNNPGSYIDASDRLTPSGIVYLDTLFDETPELVTGCAAGPTASCLVIDDNINLPQKAALLSVYLLMLFDGFTPEQAKDAKKNLLRSVVAKIEGDEFVDAYVGEDGLLTDTAPQDLFSLQFFIESALSVVISGKLPDIN